VDFVINLVLNWNFIVFCDSFYYLISFTV